MSAQRFSWELEPQAERTCRERAQRVERVAPGAVWLKQWLTVEEQQSLLDTCRALMEGPAGGYVPTVRGGGKMRVRMLCLGRHWNPLTYTYTTTRADYDNAPVPAVPEEWVKLASRAAAEASAVDASAQSIAAFQPDIALINYYGREGRMGLHQDKDESRDSIAAGEPVVSISIGDSARFLFGGFRRRDPVQHILLESGDVFVFGGPARLRYHGVSRIIPATSPLAADGRFNLTFRRY